MNLSMSHVRTILTEVPLNAKLAYCLLRDGRVPAAPKAALLTALGIIISPIDFPAWIPVLGELDLLALGILAVKTFVDACPDELVAAHRAAIKDRRSTWDEDRSAVVDLARERAGQLAENWRSRLRRAG
jgi:uncharacterized membrane protein YkvA (DUF1232 family)